MHTYSKALPEIYLWAEPTEKLRAIQKALPSELRRVVFQVEDKRFAWFSGEKLCGVNAWEGSRK